MPPETDRSWYGRLNRWERSAVVLWLAAILVVTGLVVARPRRHTVYPIFANAGRNWLEGNRLYGRLSPDLDLFRYSPLVAAAFVPLGVLPDGLGGVLWRWLSVGVYLAALWWWTRDALPRTLTRSQTAVFFLLALPLSISSLHNGQANVLVLGLLVATVAAAAAERWNLAAVCLTAACLFKVYPLVVGLLLVALYPRRFALRWAIATAAGLALPFLFQQPQYVAHQYRHWFSHLWGHQRDHWPVLTAYRDFRLLCRVWLVPLRPTTYAVIQAFVGGVIGLTCLAARRAGWPPRRLLTLVLMASLCWMTVFGPATESSTYTLLAPVLAWALIEAWLERRRAVVKVAVLAGAALLLGAQMALWFPIGPYLGSRGPQPLAALLLLGSLLGTALHACIRRRPAAAVTGGAARAA